MTQSNKMADATIELRDQINTILTNMDAPRIGENDNAYDRAVTFVEFNKWLEVTNVKNIEKLADEYGLLPIVFSLSGIDVMDVSLIQQSAKINLMGHIRYINNILILLTHGNTDVLNDLSKDVFKDKIPNVNNASEVRSKFISALLEYFINTSGTISYPESVDRLITLVEG